MNESAETTTGSPGSVNLQIDGVSVDCPAGTTLLEACRKAGARVPTLCNDPRVEAHGGCRLCMVEIEGVDGYPTSCTAAVAEGMRVRTDTETLHGMRSTIVELLLSDHRVSCPTCPSSGRCALQDLAFEFGVDGSRFAGPLHDSSVDDSDALIERDMTKCIKCARCIRVCDQLQGASVYSTRGRGFDALPDTALSLPLREGGCEFCGQCVSACPVGALTDRDTRTRRDRPTGSVRTTCGYCGVGCTVDFLTADDTIVAAEPPTDHGINRGALCAKGRYGWRFHRHADRLKKPMVRKDGELVEVEWDEAIAYTAERLSGITDEHGADAVCALASAKCTTEENYLFQRFVREVLGTPHIDHCARL